MRVLFISSLHSYKVFILLFSSPSAHSMSNSLTHFDSIISNGDSNLDSVRPRIPVMQCVCTVHYTVIKYLHTFTMLFSSPSAHSMSNSLTHFFSIICGRDSNLESV